jgi:hypothetical protein
LPGVIVVIILRLLQGFEAGHVGADHAKSRAGDIVLIEQHDHIVEACAQITHPLLEHRRGLHVEGVAVEILRPVDCSKNPLEQNVVLECVLFDQSYSLRFILLINMNVIIPCRQYLRRQVGTILRFLSQPLWGSRIGNRFDHR